MNNQKLIIDVIATLGMIGAMLVDWKFQYPFAAYMFAIAVILFLVNQIGRKD